MMLGSKGLLPPSIPNCSAQCAPAILYIYLYFVYCLYFTKYSVKKELSENEKFQFDIARSFFNLDILFGKSIFRQLLFLLNQLVYRLSVKAIKEGRFMTHSILFLCQSIAPNLSKIIQDLLLPILVSAN